MLSSTKLVAQQQDTAQNEEFEFSVNYKPIIAESKRMEETPVIKKEKSIKPTFTYSVIPIQFQTNKIVHTLPPVNHKLKINDTINGNYAKFGMGNINAFLGELYLSNRKNEKHGYGLYYNHLSSKERKTVQAWNDNKLVLFGNVYTKKFKYGASFDYNRIKNNYYGYNQDSVENTTDDNFDNLTNSYAISSYLSNVKPNRYGFNIENKMDFHYFESQLNMKESFYKLNSTISKKVNRDIKGTLGLGLSYTTNENGVDTLDIEKRRLNFRIRPGVEYAKGKSVFGGAINAVVSNANKENHYLFIYPQLYLRHALIKDELNLFANLTGDIKEYTYKELYSINPFIGEKGYLQNETTSWQIKGGVNGKISPKSNFYLELGLKKMSNMLLLVNNRDSFNRFSPVASSGNVTFVKANVDYW